MFEFFFSPYTLLADIQVQVYTTEPLEYSNIDSTNQLHFCTRGTDGLKGNSRPVSCWIEILNK